MQTNGKTHKNVESARDFWCFVPVKSFLSPWSTNSKVFIDFPYCFNWLNKETIILKVYTIQCDEINRTNG